MAIAGESDIEGNETGLRMPMAFWNRIFSRKRKHQELQQEFEAHLAIETQQRIERGESPDAARANARRDFGNELLIAEITRRQWTWRWLDELEQDLRYALRTLSTNRGFTLVVVATLTLGIGANTAIFSVVNAVLLRPLKAPDADTLVRFLTTYGTISTATAAGREVGEWRQQGSVFEDVSAHRLEFVNLTGGTDPEQIPVGRVSADFFSLFRAPVLYGRVFTRNEDVPNGGALAVLSYGIWVRRFGSDPSIVGRPIFLGSTPHIVIGILSPGFDTEQFEPLPDVWLPFQIDPQRVDGGNLFLVTGRLKRGVTLEQANARLAAAFADYSQRSSRRSTVTMWTVQHLQDAMVKSIRPSLTLLFGAVGLVLLIACANVANLLLVRGDARKREIAIRTAIGAGRARIVRQLLTESLLLWAAGGVFGLALGSLATRTLLWLYPGNNPFNLLDAYSLPRLGEDGAAVTLDWRVLGFAVLVSALTGIIFGLFPAFQGARSDPQAALKESGSMVVGGRRTNRCRSVFVVTEIALALMLLVGASLLIRTSIALDAVRPGIDTHNLLTMRMSISGTRFERRDGVAELEREGVRRIRGLPGVLAASMTCCMPLETVWQLPFIVEGRPLTGRWHAYGGWTFVSPGYFDTFKIPIIRGRDFNDGDNASAPGVVIINEAMARQFWPNGDPMNDRLIIGRTMRPEYDGDPVRQVVGIVGNVQDMGLTRDARPAMYVPVAQLPDGVTMLNVKLLPIVWLVRTQGRPYLLSQRVQNELREVSGGLPVARIRSMDEVVSESTGRTRFNTSLMTVFAASALLLAMVGVYGLMAYSVERRTHEIGIRIALGAAGRQIRNMVVVYGVATMLAGIAAGIIAAYSLSHLLAGFLFGVTTRDPIVFVAAPAILGAVALFAIWIPARRATRVSPMTLLRNN